MTKAAYLVQAETMADGHLFTPSPDVAPSSFRPWLAVPRGDRFVFKFTPVHAGWSAGSDFLFGSPRPGLAAIAAADVVLLALLVHALGGSRRAALGAGALLALCPAWIMQAGTYLPYLSSLALLLGAAVCVAHGLRSSRFRFAWFAGAGAIRAWPSSAVSTTLRSCSCRSWFSSSPVVAATPFEPGDPTASRWPPSSPVPFLS